MTTDLLEQPELKKSPTLASLAREIDELRASSQQQLMGATSENTELVDRVRRLELELAAARAQGATADQIVETARVALGNIEQEKRRAGKYQYRMECYRFKDRKGEPSSWTFWSDATTERGALEDFKGRTGAQWEQADRRGDPFKAVKVEADAPA